MSESQVLVETKLSPSGNETRTKERIDAIDLTRGLAVIFMVLIHVHDMYGNEATHDMSGPFGLIMSIISIGAPVFIFAMGLSFVYSRHKTLLSAVRRGIELIALGYLMNFIWFVIPMMLGIFPESFLEINEWNTEPLNLSLAVAIISTGDILQLSGLAYCFMGLARELIKSSRGMLVLSFIIALMSGVFVGYRPGIPVLDGLCDLMWGQEWNVYFPFVPWASTAFLGLALAMRIQEQGGGANPVFKLFLPLGLSASAIGGALWLYDPELHYRDFFHMGPGVAMCLMGVCALLLWFFHQIRFKLLPTRLGRLALYCSPRVTSIYVIHLILTVWCMSFIGFKEHSGPVVLILFLAILIASLSIDRLYVQAISLVKSLLNKEKALINPGVEVLSEGSIERQSHTVTSAS